MNMIILAIETSCDETAVSVVEFKNHKVRILAEVVSSQVKLHAPYGGVVPALAAREHLKNFVPVLRRALKKSRINLSLTPLSEKTGRGKRRIKKISPDAFYKKGNIDYIAVTNGPGLIPALMIGVSAAKALAYAWQKPLIPIHHIEGHIYANWLKQKLEIRKRERNWKLEIGNWKLKDTRREVGYLTRNRKPDARNWSGRNFELWEPEFPILCLIVSGGHTQLILMKKNLNYRIIGETRDDAAGEAFDKVAKLLGLSYPGGPIIEKLAKKGDKNKFKFPRPMINSGDFNFSFSGLKTAVLYKWKLVISNWKLGDRTDRTDGTDEINMAKADVAASFQQAVIDVLIAKTLAAAKKYKAKSILLGGGVSANKELQKQLKRAIEENISVSPRGTAPRWQPQLPITNYKLPITKLSTDNATMIAVAAYYHIANNKNIKDWKSVKADAGLKL